MQNERRNELLKKANNIPSLGNGGNVISTYLSYYAERVQSEHCIVEVGPWLGSSTAYLSIGSMWGNNPRIYSIDKWHASQDYVDKASKYHGIKLSLNQDIQPLFNSNLEGFRNIHPIKKSLFDIEWNSEKIGLLILDMGNGKIHTDHALKIFLPSCIPGHTIIFFMDFYFYESHKENAFSYQKNFFRGNRDCFEYIMRPLKSRTLICRYNDANVNYNIPGDDYVER